jgi:ketosteroid isomerase-like protein
MSRDNVEVVRRAWDAWIRGDMDALFETFHPSVEWDTTNFEGWPENEVYRGHDGIRRFFEEWLASWDRYEAGVEEYLDAEGDRVLVLCWQRGFGPGHAARC